MKDYQLALEEQETIVNWNSADEMVNIWSCQKHIITMLKKQKNVKLIKETKYGCEFEIAVTDFNLTSAVRKTVRSEAQKKVSAQNLAKLNEARESEAPSLGNIG